MYTNSFLSGRSQRGPSGSPHTQEVTSSQIGFGSGAGRTRFLSACWLSCSVLKPDYWSQRCSFTSSMKHCYTQPCFHPCFYIFVICIHTSAVKKPMRIPVSIYVTKMSVCLKGGFHLFYSSKSVDMSWEALSACDCCPREGLTGLRKWLEIVTWVGMETTNLEQKTWRKTPESLLRAAQSQTIKTIITDLLSLNKTGRDHLVQRSISGQKISPCEARGRIWECWYWPTALPSTAERCRANLRSERGTHTQEDCHKTSLLRRLSDLFSLFTFIWHWSVRLKEAPERLTNFSTMTAGLFCYILYFFLVYFHWSSPTCVFTAYSFSSEKTAAQPTGVKQH